MKWIACVLLLVGSCLPAAADEIVARVKVENPTGEPVKHVIVRGALPVPKDFDQPLSTLTLFDGDTHLRTQVQVFSTYPGSDARHPVGRPEVVQLAAAVSLPSRSFKELIVKQVMLRPKIVMPVPFRDQMEPWLTGAAPVVIEATDCFGSRYRANVLAKAALLETRQDGPVLKEQVFRAVLKPVGEAVAGKPALKRFLTVRAYLTRLADEAFASLSLMIHNGSIEHANGPVYYRDIRVGVAKPAEVAVWNKPLSPASGIAMVDEQKYTWQPCPSAPADGKVFVMPARGAAVLRLIVFKPEAKKRALQIGMNQPRFVPVASQQFWSWSNFATARYGANKYPMPFAASERALNRARKVNAPTGGWKRRGHATPAGVRYGGMTGGAGVEYVFGVPAAITGESAMLKRHIVLADRHWDRQWAHRFHADGTPYTHGRHVVEVDGRKMLDVPLDKRGWPIDVVNDPACKVQADHVKAGGLLSDDGQELLRYMKHDDQHLSRTFDAVPAAYLACDPISRDRLLLIGGHATAILNVYPFRNRPKFSGYGSLLRAKQYVDANPGKSIGFGRANGWLNQALAHAFFVSKDRQIRRDCVNAAKMDVDIREAAQMPAGNVTLHKPYSKLLGGKYWAVVHWQSVGIMGDGARCLVQMLSSPENQGYADRLKAVYVRQGIWSITVGWDKKLNAPGACVGLKAKGGKEFLEAPVFPVKTDRGGHYFGSPYAWFHEMTGDERFLDRIRTMSGGNVVDHAGGYHNLPLWSYALWLAQGGKLPDRKGFE